MNIRSLKIKVIAPVLLLLPMTCMSFGDGHHDGGHHSLSPTPSFQSSTYGVASGNMMGMEGITVVAQDSKEGG